MVNVAHVLFPARSLTINMYAPSPVINCHEAYGFPLSVAHERLKSLKIIATFVL